MNYQSFVAEVYKAVICGSSAWINPNDTVLSGSTHFSYDDAYLRLEQLSALITVIWDSNHKA